MDVGVQEWAGPIVAVTTALVGGGGLVALAKVLLVDRRRLRLDEEESIDRRRDEITDRLQADAETYRDLYHAERGRREELLEQLAEERARSTRLEERLERMDESLQRISTGDWPDDGGA